MVLISNGSGKVTISPTITSTELGYLDGVTSNVQTQLNTINKIKYTAVTGSLNVDNEFIDVPSTSVILSISTGNMGSSEAAVLGFQQEYGSLMFILLFQMHHTISDNLHRIPEPFLPVQ